MVSTIVTRGFPQQLGSSAQTSPKLPLRHPVRDGQSHRAGTGYVVPAAEAKPLAMPSPPMSQGSSRTVTPPNDSLVPSASLTHEAQVVHPSRFKAVLQAATGKLTALLGPSETSGTKLAPPS